MLIHLHSCIDAVKKELNRTNREISENKLKCINSEKKFALIPSFSLDNTLTALEVERFRNLENDIPRLISKCRQFYLERAKKKTEKIADHSSGEGAVTNKAAALLAERMAALGVKSTLQTSSSTSGSQISKTEQLNQIEQEKIESLMKLGEFENRFTLLAAKVKSVITFQTASLSKHSPINVQLESGIGLSSKVAVDLYAELRRIREQERLPLAVNKTSTMTSSSSVSVTVPISSETKPQLAFDSKHPEIPDYSAFATEKDSKNLVTKASDTLTGKDSKNFVTKVPDALTETPDSKTFDSEAYNYNISGVSFAPEKSPFKIMQEKERAFLESKEIEQKKVPSKYTPSQTVVPSPPIPSKDLMSGTRPIDTNSEISSLPTFYPLSNNVITPQTFSNDSASSFNNPVLSSTLSNTTAGAPPPPPPPPPPPSQTTQIYSAATVVKSKEPAFVPHVQNLTTNDQLPKSNDSNINNTPKDLKSNGPTIVTLMSEIRNINSGIDGKVATNNAINMKPVTQAVDMGKKDESSDIKLNEWEVISHNEEQVKFLYKVMVEFDYEGNGDGDLSVETGETLNVEKEDEEWLFCHSQNGKSGWIPKSFSRRIDTDEQQPLNSAPPLLKDDFGSAEVIFDFEARNEDELTCIAGQNVTLLAKSSDDWWMVQYNGKSGLVPSNFLRESDPFSGTISDDKSQDLDSILFSPSASVFPETDAGDENWEESTDSPSTDEHRRVEAVKEMISTEKSYVEDLFLMKAQFVTPLSKMGVELNRLFSNFLQITEVNNQILKDFDLAWSANQSLGSVFLNHLDALQCYKQYCENLNDASAFLQKVRTADPKIQAFLKTQLGNPVCKHLDLSSYILIPMQRITRYALLLRQILHYTSKTHHQYDSYVIALQLAEEFLDEINGAIKSRQSIGNIERIIKLVDLSIPSEVNCCGKI